MKKLFVSIALLFICLLVGAKVIFENKDQRWNLVEVVNTQDATVLICDVAILSNKVGCFEAHEYDENVSIYIVGDFGTYYAEQSQYEGNYTPWTIYAGRVNWNYFSKNNKGKVARLSFYFPRVPAGIKKLDWHFYGGVANKMSGCGGKYETPTFIAYSIAINDNENTTIQTKWTESRLKEEWSNGKCTPMEGIYSLLDSEDKQHWGNNYTLAIKKDGNAYQIIYIKGSNSKVWKEGEVKGSIIPTATKGIYKVREWFSDNKMISKHEMYVGYNQIGITLIDKANNAETTFIKLYPENDVDENYEMPTPRQENQELVLLGNGSGFFVGGRVLATNNHVIEDAKKIKVCFKRDNKIKEYEAEVLCSDKVNDLALLHIVDTCFIPYASLPYDISSKIVEVGTPIFTMGYPKINIMGREVKVTDGIISAKTGIGGDIVNYQISAAIQPGNSGGPTFDKDGNLIGITSSGLNKKVVGDVENVFYAIKTSYLTTLIDSAPIEIDNIFQGNLKGLDLSTQIKILEPYVVLILIY